MGDVGIQEGVLLCPLPALVPKSIPGLLVTLEMKQVLKAVVSTSSSKQIGFCGMGGIGKTTISTWIVRQDSVRKMYSMVAWITLGQTPCATSNINLLYLQLSGHDFGAGTS